MITQGAMVDLTKLEIDSEVLLIEINASHPSIGAGVIYLCNQNQSSGSAVVWKGVTYQPFPVEITGLSVTTKNAGTRPLMSIGDVSGYFTTLNYLYQDLVRAKVVLRRVLAKYLDGMPGADVSRGLGEETYYIERKADAAFPVVQYELTNGLDLEEAVLPAAQCNATHCVAVYRSAQCSYVGLPKADAQGNLFTLGADRGVWATATAYALNDYVYILIDGIYYYAVCISAHTSDATKNFYNRTYWKYDQCSQRFNTGCALRFDNTNGYPFLAFLGLTRLPQ